jgi:phosphoketolase
MHTRDSGRVHEKLVKRLERQEKQLAYQQGRFFKYKLDEIHGKLMQVLLQEKIIETDNVAAVSTALMKGVKKAANSSEFDFTYFISPIRKLVPRPNPYSLYMTQYLMEVLINDPSVIEIYGADEEVYHVINKVISRSSIQFDEMEREIEAQLARNQKLVPGSPAYQVAKDDMFRKKVGDPKSETHH